MPGKDTTPIIRVDEAANILYVIGPHGDGGVSIREYQWRPEEEKQLAGVVMPEKDTTPIFRVDEAANILYMIEAYGDGGISISEYPWVPEEERQPTNE